MLVCFLCRMTHLSPQARMCTSTAHPAQPSMSLSMADTAWTTSQSQNMCAHSPLALYHTLNAAASCNALAATVSIACLIQEHHSISGHLLQANDLISKLKEDGMNFEEDLYFTAGYDAPFK